MNKTKQNSNVALFGGTGVIRSVVLLPLDVEIARGSTGALSAFAHNDGGSEEQMA